MLVCGDEKNNLETENSLVTEEKIFEKDTDYWVYALLVLWNNSILPKTKTYCEKYPRNNFLVSLSFFIDFFLLLIFTLIRAN